MNDGTEGESKNWRVEKEREKDRQTEGQMIKKERKNHAGRPKKINLAMKI